MRKEEEADGDGPPVLVSAPLTLKVEVRRAMLAFIAKKISNNGSTNGKFAGQ